MLLEKAEGMFPEGKRGPKAFARDGPAAAMTNELLESGTVRWLVVHRHCRVIVSGSTGCCQGLPV